MKDKTDLEKMKEILDNQAERGIKSGNWNRLEYEIENVDSDITLKIPNVNIGIVFSKKGRLLGIYNYQQ
jgi:hypothetical protein